jgi:hypothetical protein
MDVRKSFKDLRNNGFSLLLSVLSKGQLFTIKFLQNKVKEFFSFERLKNKFFKEFTSIYATMFL